MSGDVGSGFEQAPEEELAKRAVGGLKWTYGSTVVNASLQVGYTIVMGRLLDAADFGLIAMAQLFLNLGQHLANAGVAAALVQKAQVTRDDVRVAVTSSLLLGLAFGGAVVAISPLAGAFYGTPRVVPVLQAMAAGLVVQAVGHTAQGLLQRRMAFRALAVVDIGSHSVGYLGVGVVLALSGAGVWSLVGAALGAQLLRTVLAYAQVRHSLVPLMRWAEFKALYGYGGRMSVIDLMEFVGTNVDTLVLGRYAGQAPLGQYNRAGLLVTLPIGYAIDGLSDVLFPTFATIQHDVPRLRRGYLEAIRLTAALIVPLAAGMAAAAPVLVPVLLGGGWEPAARILPLVALLGVAGILSHFGGVICDATATLNAKMALQATYLVVLAVALVLVHDRSLAVFTAAVAAAYVIRLLLYMGLMSRVIGVRARDYAAALGPASLTAAAVAGGIWGVGRAAGGAATPLVLLAQVATGAVVLLASLRRGPLVGVRQELVGRLAGAGSGPAVRAIGRVLGSR